MKKGFALIVLMMLPMMILGGCGSTETKAPPTKKLVIGLDDSFPPMGFRDQKNNIIGFDVDMAKEAAKRLGMEVEFKAIDWSSKEAELNGKRVDALWNGMNITEERKKNVLFSEPYMECRQLIFVVKGSLITSADQLAGKVVGVQQGSIGEDVVLKDEKLKGSFKEFKQYPDFIAAFMDLKTGRLDAVVADEILGRYYLAKEEGQYVAIEQPLGEVGAFGVGFRKDDQVLRDKVQTVLAEMKQDGTSSRLAVQWFGADIIK